MVVGWNEEGEQYHAYLANLPGERLSAEEVADLYSVRWDIGLLFKEMAPPDISGVHEERC